MDATNEEEIEGEQVQATANKKAAASPGGGGGGGGAQDFSQEIERTIAREPQDRVRCVRVFGDYYRCNWWAPAPRPVDPHQPRSLYWGVLSTHHVRMSRFLKATAADGKLVIAEVVRRASL